VITRLNHLQLRGIIELAAAFGADTFLFNRFIPGGKGLLNMEGLALTNSDLLKALQEADRASADFHIPVTVPIPVEHCEFDTAHLTHLAFGTCTCGKDKWVVDPFGNLRICEQHPEVLGNLNEEPFETLSNKKEAEDFRLRNHRSDCLDLPCFKHCGGGCRFAHTTSSFLPA
jgi:radical SAM protein with 4Fe4S-binding SPASM domain